MNQATSTGRQGKQRGAALITALMMLVILTMLGLSSMNTTTMEERMAANSQEVNRAFQTASTGLEMAFDDAASFDTSNTVASPYSLTNDEIGASGSDYAYTAEAQYRSTFQQMTAPPRGSGWDSTYGFYHFNLSSTGTVGGVTTTVNSGAYQVGKAQ